jgi:hypothetical protein
MDNVIELNLDLPTNTLHGLQQISETCSLYLGNASADASLTDAIRAFNLPTAVAPGEWPSVSVRTWDDRGAVDSLWEQPRARWGHD